MFGMPFLDVCIALGFGTLIYFISRILRLFSFYLERTGKEHGLLNGAVSLLSVLLCIFCLPVCVPFHYFESVSIRRIDDLHRSEILSVRSEQTRRCIRCQKYGYDNADIDDEPKPWE